MFFDGWWDLLRIVIVGTLAYGGLVLMLRVSGKRMLSKMNAFDLVVTVALGSTLATILLSKDVSLTEGLVGFALLCALQYVVAFISVRSPACQSLIKSEPRLLFHQSMFLRSAMRDERVTEEEILAAARSDGHGSLRDISSVVLETDGSFSLLRSESGHEVLRTVRR